MQKYIHYCWFGDKPLPKLAKKCIKSWKKYLPDFKIIRWSEENVDLNECPFIKEAYEKKKWAFVADYTRAKAMYEMGGIYFDTDMLITKNIDKFLENETFLGLEDSNMVNAAVWWSAKPKTKFAKELFNFYKNKEHFDDFDMYSISIPRIIMKILNKYNIDPLSSKVQVLDKNIYIYPRDYFYPLSYNYKNNVFTENTCMIHYFDASWVPKWEQRENKIIRTFGEKRGQQLIIGIRKTKRIIKKTIKIFLFPLVLYRRYKRKITNDYKQQIFNTFEDIKKIKGDYIVFHNPEWFGVTSATIELFDNRVPCGELLRKKDVYLIGDAILQTKIKQVIFSAMCLGFKELAIYLKSKQPNIKIKVFWHGNNSQVSEPYGWQRNMEIIDLHKKGIIDVFATCKKSLIEFYKSEGYNTTFITNKVELPKKLKGKKRKDSDIRIGLYAAKSDDWRKNMFAQIAAVSLIDNAIIDIVPRSKEAMEFAQSLHMKVDGVDKNIPRDELIQRMANNDVNLYVTFSECAPMLPLESFQVGVPCITGNNHHYFENSELEDFLVVKNEESAIEISEKIKKCLNEKDKILKLYQKFEKANMVESKEEVKKFLEM